VQQASHATVKARVGVLRPREQPVYGPTESRSALNWYGALASAGEGEPSPAPFYVFRSMVQHGF